MKTFSLKIEQKNFDLNFLGNLLVLDSPKISIIGSRNCTQYTKNFVTEISSKLAKNGVKIVSGGAIGVDIIAHKSAGAQNSICVLPSGIGELYPAINKKYLEEIAQNGLLISQFENNFKATNWSFVLRNEIVVALGDKLIAAEAELKSGSMKSIEFALKQNKKIFVPLHRIGESSGTNYLLKNNLAEPIWDIGEFVQKICGIKNVQIKDEFLLFCQKNPNYETVFAFDSQKLFEYELLGKIKIENGKVFVV